MSYMVPKLFFVHFQNTSFVAEEDSKILGVLIGFTSPSNKNEAYIHFVGVHPEYRGQQIGKSLYYQFFNIAQQNDRDVIRCITSPVNKSSIAYHKRMGFDIVEGDKYEEEIHVHSDYDGPGQDRVLFSKKLSK
ncbi:GNAT family N-acetyltransferase [Pontibacillus sp. HMF3514]|uniref:GNAT family N-acetyltransferase n=1 Tax=Pontibacillus sp. HMF3514 TaxID=2692425 RepID=UPI00131FB5BE|nr:GNAT family N-acetyltransferase [Pontibacillus sp. HMF3514]